ncbi:MAG: cob(I)yrinic acid a,c-diamide adenosyltransferase [Bacillota bacterium]
MGSAKRGLVLVFTGDGKGKTTAALGLALRAWGQGLRVLVIQFVKGDVETGELKAAARMDGLEVRPLGAGFVFPGDEEGLHRHREAAAAALGAARAALEGRGYEMVVLDEIFVALSLGLVTLDEVSALPDQKPEGVHLVLTGRGAPPEIVARADLVTEMREIKHHYRSGVGAQRGIEY